MMLPGLIGAWLILCGENRWVALWFALASLPYLFIHSRGAPWRLGAEAHILAAWAWGAGIVGIGRFAMNKLPGKAREPVE